MPAPCRERRRPLVPVRRSTPARNSSARLVRSASSAARRFSTRIGAIGLEGGRGLSKASAVRTDDGQRTLSECPY